MINKNLRQTALFFGQISFKNIELVIAAVRLKGPFYQILETGSSLFTISLESSEPENSRLDRARLFFTSARKTSAFNAVVRDVSNFWKIPAMNEVVVGNLVANNRQISSWWNSNRSLTLLSLSF